MLDALGVKHPSKLSHRLAPPMPEPGAYEHQVGPLAEFRNGRYHRKRPLITPLQLVEPTQVFQSFLLEGHGERRPTFGSLFLDPHQVQAGAQLLDRLEHLDDLGILLAGDLAGNEDAEVAHALMEES